MEIPLLFIAIWTLCAALTLVVIEAALDELTDGDLFFALLGPVGLCGALMVTTTVPFCRSGWTTPRRGPKTENRCRCGHNGTNTGK
jgi:hypothetical protein